MIWIGLDDTDVPGSPGTGHLARELAARLGRRYPVYGVTRHQLLKDPRIPMTAKNSAAVIHLRVDGSGPWEDLVEELAEWISGQAAAGSSPGLCVAWRVPEEVVAFGRRAKREIVSAGEALAVARRAGVVLRGLKGKGRGIIGALAGVGLAASGEDGRFVLYRRLRDLRGLLSVTDLLAEGVASVQTTAGKPVTAGLVDTKGKLRPSLIGGRPVLWVRRDDENWVAVCRD